MVVAAPSSAGNRFRQRKISTKQTLQIFKQSQVSDIDNEDLQQRDIQEIETGVDKNEEDEVHLQKILKKTGISNTSDTYIPTPDASKVWPEASKYYTGRFQQPESYIKSSCQVEDYVGSLYNMDEEDEEFFEKITKELNEEKKPLITEDEYEVLFEWFEKTIFEKQPFLVTDPYQILPFDEIKLEASNEVSSSNENVHQLLAEDLQIHPFVTLLDVKSTEKPRPLTKLLELYGKKIYEFYRERKLKRLGKSVTPSLKFTGEDDSDAYICFRQRQFRQQRKTRRADTQSSEKLLKLYQELKKTKDLTFLVAQREIKRLEAIETEKEIFELRCKVKALKRDLGINDSDEDLVAHKKKKIVPPAETRVEDRRDKKGLSKVGNNVNIPERGKGDNLAGSDSPQQFQPYVKLPPSKIPDMELETVQNLLDLKDVSMQKFVEEKMNKRKQLDVGFTNLTDNINSPYFNLVIQDQDIVDPSHTPYSSITSSLYNVQSFGYIPGIDKYVQKGTTSKDNDAIVFNPKTQNISKKYVPEKYNPFTSKSVNTSEPIMTIRKRIGRLGQVYIDRKAMIKNYEWENAFEGSGINDDDDDIELKDKEERFEDRWKFDTDLSPYDIDSEPFSDDPSKINSISNDTQVIRFGAMLLSKSYDTLKEAVLQQRQQQYYQQLQRAQAQAQAQQSQSQTQAQTPQAQTPQAQTPQAQIQEQTQSSAKRTASNVASSVSGGTTASPAPTSSINSLAAGLATGLATARSNAVNVNGQSIRSTPTPKPVSTIKTEN